MGIGLAVFVGITFIIYLIIIPPDTIAPSSGTPPPIGEGWEVVWAYAPEEWPDWAPDLVEGEYSDGKIAVFDQKFTVLMGEFARTKDNERLVMQRISIENQILIDRFVNFTMPGTGPPGVEPEPTKGQRIIDNNDLYLLLFANVEGVTLLPPPWD